MDKRFLFMIIIILILSTFTILYFVKPRTLIIETEIPGEIQIEFRPSPPDTVFAINILPNDTIYSEIFREIYREDMSPATYMERDTTIHVGEIAQDVIVSMKTFHKSFLLGDVASEIIVFAPIAVYGMENNITLYPDREYIVDRMNKEIKEGCRVATWRGIAIGSGITAGVILGIMSATR